MRQATYRIDCESRSACLIVLVSSVIASSAVSAVARRLSHRRESLVDCFTDGGDDMSLSRVAWVPRSTPVMLAGSNASPSARGLNLCSYAVAAPAVNDRVRILHAGNAVSHDDDSTFYFGCRKHELPCESLTSVGEGLCYHLRER